jgi:hypothetical protein
LSAELIAPFYTFPFYSDRPERSLRISGSTLPEISTVEISAPTSGSSEVTELIAASANRLVAAGTVFVAVTHVDQVSLLQSVIRHPKITVSTLNRLQGLEADAVIALDPLFDGLSKGERVGDLGRLCVGLSRHKSHLTFVTNSALHGLLAQAAAYPSSTSLSKKVLSTNLTVRTNLKAFL